MIVSPSAYPLAFPKALASETIPSSPGLWLTTYSRSSDQESHGKGYLVPNFRFALHVGSHSPPGLPRVLTGQRCNCLSLILSLLGKPNNPRRLVHDNDGSNVDSLALAVCSSARRDSQSGSE
jgi:hypothetical protein